MEAQTATSAPVRENLPVRVPKNTTEKSKRPIVVNMGNVWIKIQNAQPSPALRYHLTIQIQMRVMTRRNYSAAFAGCSADLDH